MVDQSPIGRTTRSNPASYVGAFEAIRKLFAAAPAALERRYTRGHLQLQLRQRPLPGLQRQRLRARRDAVPVRRLPALPRLQRHAATAPEVLEMKLEGSPGQVERQAKSIADVLEMTVTEALAFFNGQPRGGARAAAARRRRARLPAARPAGADALRRRSAAPEARRPSGGSRAADSGFRRRASRLSASLFLFDEPTTGLHFDDVAKLLRAFRKLLAAGHSLIVIEHNLDVIRAADWIIDLGPEGGDAGGEIVCAGTPKEVASRTRLPTPARPCATTKPRSPPPWRKSRRAPALGVDLTTSRPHDLTPSRFTTRANTT